VIWAVQGLGGRVSHHQENCLPSSKVLLRPLCFSLCRQQFWGHKMQQRLCDNRVSRYFPSWPKDSVNQSCRIENYKRKKKKTSKISCLLAVADAQESQRGRIDLPPVQDDSTKLDGEGHKSKLSAVFFQSKRIQKEKHTNRGGSRAFSLDLQTCGNGFRPSCNHKLRKWLADWELFRVKK